ncbi:MAG TPA: hypothetical protein PKN44_10130 [Bacteroidales bacterium]|nr:hypothetical protein [Bacteroidales bacterium]
MRYYNDQKPIREYRNPHYGLIALLILLLLILMMNSCRSSRNVATVKQQETSLQNIEGQVIDTSKVVTKTDSHVYNETEITETIDTNVTVKDQAGNPITVPVRLNRKIKKKEVSAGNQVRNESNYVSGSVSVETGKTSKSQDRQVQTKRVSPWPWVILSASVLLILLFVFLWKRNLFSRIFDYFRK